MTEKAISIMSKNPNGFFLLVEGSQIDWACHNNDAYGAVRDFLEFDNAVKKSLEYAKETGNTLVIVCPDHGTGGISLGNKQSNTDYFHSNKNKYDKINIEKDIIQSLKEIKVSGRKLGEMIMDNAEYLNNDSIRKYYNIRDKDISNKIRNVVNLKPRETVIDSIQYILGSTFNSENYIGWTTTGHTADDVFLGIYLPEGKERLAGVVDNSEIGKYIGQMLNVSSLKDSTDKYYCSHKKLFKAEEIKHISTDSMVVVKKGQRIVYYANSNKLKIQKGKMTINRVMSTIAVCIKLNGKEPEYYLQRDSGELF